MACTMTITPLTTNILTLFTHDRPPTPPPRSPRRTKFSTIPTCPPSPPELPLPSPAEGYFPWGLPPIQELPENHDNSHTATEPPSRQPSQHGKNTSLSMKVAQSAHLVRQWLKELEDWAWDGTFEKPNVKKDSSTAENPAEDIFWRSFPTGRILAYTARVTDISRQLRVLDIEDQQGRLQHIYPPRHDLEEFKKPPEHLSLLQLYELDDLTALTTLTLHQALPTYNSLRNILKTWQTRLSILTQLPAFHARLGQTQEALDKAWQTIGLRTSSSATPKSDPTNPPQPHTPRLRRVPTATFLNLNTIPQTHSGLRKTLQNQITSLWESLDVMRDMLETNTTTDILPEKLTTAIMAIEQDFSHWSVSASAKLLQHSSRGQNTRAALRVRGVDMRADARMGLAGAAAAAASFSCWRIPQARGLGVASGNLSGLSDGEDDCLGADVRGVDVVVPRTPIPLTRKESAKTKVMQRPDSGYVSEASESCDGAD